MSHLYKAYDMLDRELEEIVADGKIEKEQDIELLKCISGGMKNLKTIIAMDEAEDDYRFSGARRGGRGGGRRSSGDGWGDSRRGSYMRSERRGGYSRDDGMENVMEKLEEVKMAVRKMED